MKWSHNSDGSSPFSGGRGSGAALLGNCGSTSLIRSHTYVIRNGSLTKARWGLEDGLRKGFAPMAGTGEPLHLQSQQCVPQPLSTCLSYPDVLSHSLSHWPCLEDPEQSPCSNVKFICCLNSPSPCSLTFSFQGLGNTHPPWAHYSASTTAAQ